ncbi:MAG: hypothetical protein H6843_11120 [Rhodospirillaceae bacterium]|nr:hypothetical protein [Rhodospirillaceae bacterium]
MSGPAAPHPDGDRLDGAVAVDGLAGACAAAEAARSAGRAVHLIPAAGPAVGPGWWRAVCRRAAAAVPGADIRPVYDAGAVPGLVMAALRTGIPAVLYTGPEIAALRGLAGAHGTTLYRALGPCLKLDPRRRPVAAVTAWLGGIALQSERGCSIPGGTRARRPAPPGHADFSEGDRP